MEWRIVTREEVGSTNDEICRAASQGAPEGLVIRADRQVAGRGRQGRIWHSPAGNLFASLLLRPARPQVEWPGLALLTAVALADGIETACGISATLKWPNDLQIDGRKLAGILIESEGEGWVCVGTGVNVAQHPGEAAGNPTTSLAAHGAAVTAAEVLDGYLAAFAGHYRTWQLEGMAAVVPRWQARATGIGGRATVRLPQGSLEGIYEGIDRDGTLQLRTPMGLRRVSAGEVFLSNEDGHASRN